MTPFSELARVVGDRTLAIVCQGPSAPFVSTAGTKDWCYASINRASLVESLCPNPLEIVYCSSWLRISQESAWIESFNGVFISGKEAIGRLKRPILRDDKNPAHGPMNTLSAFLFCLLKAGVKDVVLFGCDGTGGTYYRKEEYRNECNRSVHNDSQVMNRLFWLKAKQYAPEWKGSIVLAHPEGKSEVKCFPIVDLNGLRDRKLI